MATPGSSGSTILALAGAGPVAQALGRALRECGIQTACVGSRDPEHAARAAAFIGGGARPVRYREIPREASHVLVAVSDRAIAAVAEELAAAPGGLRAALHTCGGCGPEVLAPLSAAGVACGSLHPFQTIREPGRGAAALRGAAFAVSGDADAVSWAEEIARALGGQVLRIRPEARPLYHAAAVMASNYTAALLDGAERLMALAGVPRADARRALAPLTRATVDNIFDCGAAEALTGPAARGDAATVAAHLAAIGRAEPSLSELYRAAGLHALEMARRRGLGAADAERVRRAFLERR